MTVAELIPVLQLAVGPVVLISGVGLLILSLTNRLGRIVDRGRALASEKRQAPQPAQRGTDEQLCIISRRAHLLRWSIIFAVFCDLFASLLIILLFFTAALKLETAWLIGVLFVCSLLSIIISLIFFLTELKVTLDAFQLDIGV